MKREFKFDFGTASAGAAEGYTKITADTVYDPTAGCGFVAGAGRVYAKDRGESAAALKRDFVIPLEAVFLVDVPDGTYQVTLMAGDDITETETTVKAGEGRLMVLKHRTSAGQYATHAFSVWVTDGKLRLAFSGLAPRVNAVEIAPRDTAVTLFLAGDSTVTDQPAEGWPYTGWGQMLPKWLKADVAVANYALSGRSSKSFISEGHLDKIWARMKPQDYLLIQFGHNDQKADEERHTDPFTTYKETLKLYIDGARSRQAVPVLVTSVQRRFFDAEGRLIDTHGDYLTAMRELAQEEGVPLVDLAEKSRRLFEELGPEETKKLFLWAVPGEYINHPNGVEDNTHFHELGGIRVAELVAESLKELGLQPLRMYLRF
ncbi:rhamnogalacturonan acetylesterase [Gorillibacterium sp. sgz5001074]|uniref:rhamnogalacturonan acetylesterase n=1 Tax=Gorillibacterium sp. sgz5001074 TaxID=3446695 RepID=UPI003F6776A2